MSFQAVQNQIAQREGVGPQAAGAILASKTRNASPAAKKANPNLKKVKGKPNKPAAKTKAPSQWSGIANQMLASGVTGPKSGNGGR
jgi:DNA transposition AAA+ family ATPase